MIELNSSDALWALPMLRIAKQTCCLLFLMSRKGGKTGIYNMQLTNLRPSLFFLPDFQKVIAIYTGT